MMPVFFDQAKAYQKTKQILSLVHIGYMAILLVFLVFAPLTVHFRDTALGLFRYDSAALGVYFLFLSLFILAFDFPFSFYSGYVLEKKYGLSNHTLKSWFLDFAKSSILSFALSLLLLEALYFLIRQRPADWWVWAWMAYAFFSYILGKVFPVIIIPMFYRYGPVENEEVKRKILALADKYRMPVENIFSLNLSRTTKKANAAFMGMGKTKRVVLSDTLLDQFTPDEIESVAAHELGHYTHKDIWRNMAFGLVMSLISFWIAFKVMSASVFPLGFDGVADPAAMPLLFLVFYFVSLGLTPAQSGFSRHLERGADLFALKATGNREAFISTMQKLSRLNLSDPSPHPVYEWFFYDHPSAAKRIRAAENWKGSPRE